MSDAIFPAELVPEKPRAAVPLRDSTWHWTVVVLGIVFLFGLQSAAWILPRQWLQAAGWIFFVPLELFLCIYPFVTRRESGFSWPGVRRIVIEALWAVPLTFGMIFAVYLCAVLLYLLLPEVRLTPKRYEDMQQAQPTLWIYLFMLGATTIGPVAEEIFFRGFLLNAFRARMPLAFAVLLQGAIFGVIHYYEIAPTVVTAIMGVLLGLIYQWRRSLWTPIFVHSAYNLLSVIGVLVAMHQNANAPMLGVMAEGDGSTCVVGKVVPGSPAAEAGVQAGDVIVEVDGESVADFPAMIAKIRKRKAGEVAALKIKRGDEQLEFSIPLKSRAELFSQPLPEELPDEQTD
jgi:membrane protease YdiL (CAAX protease family)